MKKLLLIVALLVFSIVPVHASSTQINKMTINCVIDANGTGTFTEVWDMEANRGTEVYKTFKNMNDQSVSLISVSEGGKKYQNIGNNWDVNASRSEKKDKCGITQSGSTYEICFGIGDYGHKTYTFVYKVAHLVNQYSDTQGINYAFMGDMSIPVSKVMVDVKSELESFTADNSDIWGFGYEGRCDYMENGTIHMLSTGKIKRVQLFAKLEQTYASPSLYHQDEDFEDVKSDAMEGSSFDDEESNVTYGEDGELAKDSFFDVFLKFFYILFAAVGGLIFLTGLIASKKKAKMIFEDGSEFSKKDVHPFRDIPTKNIAYFYYLADHAGLIKEKTKGGIMSAYVLRWIKNNQVSFKKTEENGFFRKKEGYQIDFSKPLTTEDPLESRLYDMFVKASGKNLILETKEFEKWCKRHYESVVGWFEKVEKQVRKDLRSQKLLIVSKKYRNVLGISLPKTTETFKMKVKDDMEHVYGLNKFLIDQDNMKEKEVIEVQLWEEYLMYATILGIADVVEEQLKIVKPSFEQEMDMNYYNSMLLTRAFVYQGVINANNAYHTANSGSAFSGGGGGSSFGGGGGGFSGGGGGGVR